MAKDLHPYGAQDLAVDRSRCLRMRFCDSSCGLCVEACPSGAIALSESLTVDRQKCRGCLLCTVACRTGALEPARDLSRFVVQMSRAAEPILGCLRSGGDSPWTLGCLGGLADEHLVALECLLSGTLTLDLTACSECPSGCAAAELERRLAGLYEAGLVGRSLRIVAARTGPLPGHRGTTVNRRGFFKDLGKTLLQGAALALQSSGGGAASEQEPASYGEKRLPASRELLNRGREAVPQEERARIARRFDWRVGFDGCTMCHGCGAICPSGALRASAPDAEPIFDASRCTGCGLCREFCAEDALRLSRTP